MIPQSNKPNGKSYYIYVFDSRYLVRETGDYKGWEAIQLMNNKQEPTDFTNIEKMASVLGVHWKSLSTNIQYSLKEENLKQRMYVDEVIKIIENESNKYNLGYELEKRDNVNLILHISYYDTDKINYEFIAEIMVFDYDVKFDLRLITNNNITKRYDNKSILIKRVNIYDDLYFKSKNSILNEIETKVNNFYKDLGVI